MSLFFILVAAALPAHAAPALLAGFSTTTALLLLSGILLLVVVILLTVGNSLLHIRARELGVLHFADPSIFPSKGGKSGSVDGKAIRLRRGYNIKLKGEARGDIREAHASRFAVQPPNFRGLSPIPKVVVEIGQAVKAGQELFHDKNLTEVKFVSPVSGEVIEVRRGEKRAISHVVILADKTQTSVKLSPPALASASREELVGFLAASGFWPLIRQRPYNIMADLTVVPRDIFISTFDTAPLAPDLSAMIDQDGEAFQAGLDVLGALTQGRVHLGVDGRPGRKVSGWITGATGVVRHSFNGPHPAGCVGVQIHHIRPVKPKDIVWTLGVQDVMMLGRMFRDNTYDATRVIALTGAELDQPGLVKTMLGASIQDLVGEGVTAANNRLVSGDVLSGNQKGKDDFMDAHDYKLTVLQEGNTFELFGWLLPIRPRPSVSRTFPNFLMPNYTFRAETNTHGEERAFVHTGLYESVTPMDIYPQHLLKAILTGNIEKMEGLGIHEVVEEDLALCEFVCPSKINVQEILRDGLDMMQEQG